ncbi:pilus assembly protein PilM [Bisgaard Taxon 45]
MIKFSSGLIQIGIWQKNDNLELVWLDKMHQPHVLFCPLHQLSTLDQLMKVTLNTHKLHRRNYYFVSAISPHHIWSKAILLPHSLSDKELDCQARFLLAQELPIPLSELWFDYYTEQLQQGCKLTVLALQRNIAKQALAPLMDLNVRVLDSALYALLRGFQFLLAKAEYSKTLFLYQDEQGCIAIQEKGHQVLHLQRPIPDLKQVYTQFCQHYSTEIDAVVVYREGQSIVPLQSDWTVLQTDIPLIALGNALWQGKLDT